MDKWKTYIPPDFKELSMVVNAGIINLRKALKDAKSGIEVKAEEKPYLEAGESLAFDVLADSYYNYELIRNFPRQEEVDFYVQALKKAGANEVVTKMCVGLDPNQRGRCQILYKGKVDEKKLIELICS